MLASIDASSNGIFVVATNSANKAKQGWQYMPLISLFNNTMSMSQLILLCLWSIHRYLKKSRLLKFCYVLASIDASSNGIFAAATKCANKAKQGRQYMPLISLFDNVMSMSQLILLYLWTIHRYLKNIDCLSFVMCLLLSMPLPMAFLSGH